MDFNVSKYCVTSTSCMTSRGGRTIDNLLELLDGNLQAFDDRLALVGDSLSLQRLAFRFRLGLLDHQNLLRLAAGISGHLFALRRVDVVHRRLDLRIGNNIGHQHIDDLIAEGRHVGIEFLLHRRGDRLDCEANTSSSVMPGTWPRITCST